jgi:GntR family transcriptional repressor for pyruvate dehydrogenase complex
MAGGKRQKRSELVADNIRQLIVDEGLKPGDRLPTEKEMAERFGVSRVSVREATKALSFLGIIHAAPRRGLTLGTVDMGRVTQYLTFHFALADYPRSQLVDTRLAIESGALPYVARAMAADRGVYDRLAAQVEASRPDNRFDACLASDIGFHRALLESSGISPLLAFDDLLRIFFDRFYAASDTSDRDPHWPRIVDEHQALIEHLRAGDVDSARRVLSDHLGKYKAVFGD